MPLERCSSRPVAAGEAPVKDPGQVLRGRCRCRCRRSPGVASPLQGDGHLPGRVYFKALLSTCSMTKSSHFSSVSTQILAPWVVQRELFPDEGSGVIPYRPADNRVQGRSGEGQSQWCRRPAAGRPAPSVHTAPPACSSSSRARLWGESSSRSSRCMAAMGGLDLVGPDGVILHHIPVLGPPSAPPASAGGASRVRISAW